MTDLSARKKAGAAQANALRAQASAGGLRFEAYLPPQLAVWVLSLIEGQIVDDPSEAVSVIMQDSRDLLDALDDAIPTGSPDEVMVELRARIASRAEPARWQNSHRGDAEI